MAPTFSSSPKAPTTIKFLCSYGGKIVPRPTDGELRYVGGQTRVLSVDRSITFLELMVKFGELCGSSMDLKCKLPSEDLDVLISIKSEEELRSVIGEYDRVSPEAKIRAVLFPIKSAKKVSPPSSPLSCFDFPSARKPQRRAVPVAVGYCAAPPFTDRCFSPAVGYPVIAGEYRNYAVTSPRHLHRVPHRNYAQ
ncbi:uncharacterized protein LOC105179375 [Sesamum indicum]|uniref:Uncharacterized protein LOC105179375 n=1 Tax=Sesamum indicum TaxID=4182 RepID=A0A6I9UL84_SESIN|nr:uncharacterized protein LOC105179375 [Sesamum indicum]